MREPDPCGAPRVIEEGPASLTIHASTVAIGGRAVVLVGGSGAGKSDLALRLIDRGAVLVADDCTCLVRAGSHLLASVPTTIAGRMEVRGLGILTLPHVADVPVALALELGVERERMPPPRTMMLGDVAVPALVIDPTLPAAAIKVEHALAQVIA